VPTVPREPSEVDTSTAQSSVEVDAKLRAV
jgi:hypothetical protein